MATVLTQEFAINLRSCLTINAILAMNAVQHAVLKIDARIHTSVHRPAQKTQTVCQRGLIRTKVAAIKVTVVPFGFVIVIKNCTTIAM